jgi:hypothetical protein
MKLTSIVLLLFLLISVSGCKKGTRALFLDSAPLDLVNPNGAYEEVLYGAVDEALESNEIDFSKYKDKEVSYTLTALSPGYAKIIVSSMVKRKLYDVRSTVISPEDRLAKELPEEVIKKSKDTSENNNEKESRYFLNVMVPVAGVHEYNGLLRKYIEATVLINISESDEKNNHKYYKGKMITKKYDHFILNDVVIVVFWIVLILLLMIVLYLMRSKLFVTKKSPPGFQDS